MGKNLKLIETAQLLEKAKLMIDLSKQRLSDSKESELFNTNLIAETRAQLKQQAENFKKHKDIRFVS